jgi:hypothetical protein
MLLLSFSMQFYEHSIEKISMLVSNDNEIVDVGNTQFTSYSDRSQWFVLIAVILFMLGQDTYVPIVHTDKHIYRCALHILAGIWLSTEMRQMYHTFLAIADIVTIVYRILIEQQWATFQKCSTSLHCHQSYSLSINGVHWTLSLHA